MKAIVYSKDQCPQCIHAKQLLFSKGVEIHETKLGVDIIREDFISMFPDVKTMPLIFIDGERVGGLTDLKEFFSGRPELLRE